MWRLPGSSPLVEFRKACSTLKVPPEVRFHNVPPELAPPPPLYRRNFRRIDDQAVWVFAVSGIRESMENAECAT